MNCFTWLFILIHVMCIVDGQGFRQGTGKLLRMATKERLNQESMMILRQKEMMNWLKYQQLWGLEMPLAQLKRLNNYNKWNIEHLKRENNELKSRIVNLQAEIQQIKYDTETLKKENSVRSKKSNLKKLKEASKY
eukprot:279920_1